MKGDFSRSTFDPHNHYTSVRMQQGRVQLDADWNEQADILLHLIATQVRDLLGPGGTMVTEPGFAITLEPAGQAQANQPEELADQSQAEQPEEPAAPARTLPDFQIGAGRYYVDGILCENDAPVQFSKQPDYPAAASLQQKSDHFLVYLDVWGRHLTAAQDPAIREVALGGPDTTTRVRTVWQVKLLPLSGEPADDEGWRDRGGLRSLADWEAFVNKAAAQGRLQAKWEEVVNKAAAQGRLQAKWEEVENTSLENHLYRVEVHAATGGKVEFKWSRENGSIVFPIVALPSPEPSGDGIGWLTVEGLDRDPHELEKGSWVEFVDDVTELNGPPLPLCQVKEVDRPNARVNLRADETTLGQIRARILAEIDAKKGRDPLLRYPLLRRWDGVAEATDSAWLHLEDGVWIKFGNIGTNQDKGTYQVGDYWLIPARTRSEYGIEWPQKDGQPLALAPHGIAHHYVPLALLQFREGGWRVIPDEGARFATAPEVEARLARVDRHFDEHADELARLDNRVSALEERQAFSQAPIVQYFQMADEIEAGHVVSVIPLHFCDEPDSELEVRLANSENARDRRLVVGVVKDILEQREDRAYCRVVLYGRAQCKVIGEIKPGDVLVPSVKSGYAQKAGRFPQPATILGKALGSTKFDPEVIQEIDEGMGLDQLDKSRQTGTVDMMVTLR